MQGKLADMYFDLASGQRLCLRRRRRPATAANTRACARMRPAQSSMPPKRRPGWRGEAIQALGGVGYTNEIPPGACGATPSSTKSAPELGNPPHADRPRTDGGNRLMAMPVLKTSIDLRSERFRRQSRRHARPGRRVARKARARARSAASRKRAATRRRAEKCWRASASTRCSIPARRFSKSANWPPSACTTARRPAAGVDRRDRPRAGRRMHDRRQRRHGEGRHLLSDHGEETSAGAGDRASRTGCPASIWSIPAAPFLPHAGRGVSRPRPFRPHLLQPGEHVGDRASRRSRW